jgi:diamine N-acetyltransferase
VNVIFESENIQFTEVSEQLIPDYLAMINDMERVGRVIGERTEPYTVEKEREWVRKKLAEKTQNFSMLEKKTGAFIGNIELTDIQDGVGMLGIAVTAEMQDKGFGTEAVAALVNYGFERLGLRRIWLKAYPFNARALHVYEKCGFREYDRTEKDVYMEVIKA